MFDVREDVNQSALEYYSQQKRPILGELVRFLVDNGRMTKGTHVSDCVLMPEPDESWSLWVYKRKRFTITPHA